MAESQSRLADEQAEETLSESAQAASPPTQPGASGQARIIKLVLDGFKSFGKRTELLFDEGFNCILGPNGSGKSNVLDSLCFVLGKSSSKSMRVEKSANLIYNGGKTRNPAKQAEVTIVFDNKEKAFPLDDEEIKLTRIVRQSGQSKYKINGKTRTRQEVLELLAAANINPDGYNIILQGDIVRFVTMSGTERRQVIEEIAGIGIYEEKKASAVKELDKVQEKLNQAEIILKERSGHLKDLKKDRDHALKYKELTSNIANLKASYVRIQMNGKEAALAKLEAKVSKNKELHEKYMTQIKASRETIVKQRDRIKAISAEVEKSGEQKNSLLAKEIERLRVDIATKKTKLDASTQELTKIDSRENALKNEIETLQERHDKLESSHATLLARKETLEKQLSDISERLSAFRSKHKLDEGSARIEEELDTIDKTLDDLTKESQTLRESQQQFLREKDKIDFQLQTIDQQIAKVRELEEAHKHEIKALKARQKEFKQAVVELNTLLTRDSKDASEVAQLKKELTVLEEEYAKLQVKSAAVQESIAGNLAIKKVLENKKQLGAVYGTIGELGQTPGKYALALEIAAGNKINSIVVEDDKTAAKCISYLKQNKLGSASFIPLNKIKPPKGGETKSLSGTSGVHGLAIDLINFDSHYKQAFRFVFGTTVVVQDITTIRRIGVGAAKMVTIDGDVSELSGLMTGGFRKKRKGAFKDTDLTGALSKKESAISTLQSRISSLLASRMKNEDEIQRLRELKASLEGEIIKTEKALHLDSTDLTASQEYKNELQDKLKGIDKEQQDVNRKLTDLTKKITQLKIDKAKARQEMSALRSPTILAELNAYDEKRRKLQEELVTVQTEEKSLSIQLHDVVKRDLENAGKVIKELDKERKHFLELQKNLEKELKSLNSVVKEKEAEQAKMYSQFKTLFDERNKLSDSISSLETTIFTLEDKARKEEVQINLVSMEEAKFKAELAGLAAEFAQYEGAEVDISVSEDELKKRIREFEKMKETIGSVNMRALEIYETVEKEFAALTEKKDTLAQEKDDVLKLMDEIETSKKARFLQTFEAIRKHFITIFTELSKKGVAELELDNPENPFEGGMQIRVKLSGSKFLDIRSLSGGEKTMTALAFIFAIQDYAPATFYILDEVDAALDKANSKKLAALIKQYSSRAQYVVISHNDTVVSHADTLYGISMGEHGLSNTVSMKI